MRENPLHSIDTQPGHLIRRVHQRSTAIFMEESREFDVTPPQYAALAVIDRNPGVDGATLSDLVAFDRATVGSILERLEKKGLVIRKPHATDGRAKVNFVTVAGKRTLAKISGVMPAVAEKTLHGLTADEQGLLLSLLQRIVLSGESEKSE